MKVSLIVLLGLVAVTMLRKRSAAVRHWVLATAIVCAAATPALELVVPAWHLPLNLSPFGRAVEPLTLLIPVPAPRPETPARDVQQEGRAPVQRTQALVWLRPIWWTGVGICLSVLFVGFARLTWLASRSQRILHGKWIELAQSLSRAHGLRRPVRVLQSNHPTLLVTWGLLRPKVILPRAARDWPEDRMRIVLSHELAHIRRWDWLVHMTAELLRCVYWFNPLLWIACKRLRQESERACDDAVLSLGVDGSEYATHLLHLARAFRRQQMFLPAPAMARSSSLERRISAMLNAHLNRRPITRSACIVTIAALLSAAAAIAGLGASVQTATATFSGTLMDTVGRVLPDVSMTLSGPGSGARHEARSDQAGHFMFAELPAGDYVLEVGIPGFARTESRLTFQAGQHFQRDVALQLGSITETVTVTTDDVSSPPPPPPPPPPAHLQPGLAAPPPPPPPPPPPESTSSFGQTEVDLCSQSSVGGCIVPPKHVKLVRPQYPQTKRDAGIAGAVTLEGRIGTDGLLKDLRVLTPADTDFANAALEAVRQWQFTPTRLDGVPMEVQIRVTANFVASR